MLRARHIGGAAPLALLFILPLMFSLLLLLPGFLDLQSFTALFQHPQIWGATRLTLLTGLSSTALSLLLAIVIVQSTGPKTLAHSTVFMALPHLALAVGLVFLMAPTGVLARVLAGGTAPPDWQFVQHPYGLGLVVALVLKETPFLVWSMATVLQNDAQRYASEMRAARSLGHGARASFTKIILPQILPRIIWPMVAVLSYGLTVVDMALVIGPAQPPTLAQLVWTDVNDGEVLTNQRGAAGTLFLSAMIVALLAMLWVFAKTMRPIVWHYLTRAASPERPMAGLGIAIWRFWFVLYALVIAALLLQSISLHWPYPQLLAEQFSSNAWFQIASAPQALTTSVLLGIATSTTALAASLCWLEFLPPRHDAWALATASVLLCVPALVVGLGQYRVLLHLGWTGTAQGLFAAHLLPVTAYVFLMLHGPYRGYDQRWQSVGQGLGASSWRFLVQVKWPMLRASLLSALAVGFSVSMVQFVPAQLAAAGRFSTFPMQAVTLSSGGNRALMSAYALVLMVRPLLGFAWAALASKRRWPHA
jgi:putative thiamine transport system permease protein